MKYTRPEEALLNTRLGDPVHGFNPLAGLRQVGKTIIIRDIVSAGQEVRKRNSAPKLHVFNTALMSALQDYSFAEAQADRSYWGRLVESSVGAHLLNTIDEDTKLYYWREGSQEIDFVLAKGKKLTAIEVKSAPKPVVSAGLSVFGEKYPHAKKVLVGAGGVPLAEFLSQPADDWLE